VGRIGRGWRIVMASWGLVWETPALLVLPAAGLLFIAAAALSVLAFAGGPAAIGGGHLGLGLVIWGAILDFPWTLISVFCGVAFASQVSACLEGGRSSVREGLRVAWSRRAAIAWWALVSAGVGVLLRAIGEIPGLGRIGEWVASLAGAAWDLVTVIVVPFIALEPGGAREAMAGSAKAFRARWAEELTGGLATGVIGTLLLLPGLLVLGAGFAAYQVDASTGLWVVSIGMVLAIPAAIFFGAANDVFLVALYRHASGRSLPDDFTEEDLRDAFQPRRRWWSDDD